MFKKAVRRTALWLLAALALVVAISMLPQREQVAATAYQNGEYTKAAKLWRKMAKGGDGEAQYNLGVLYMTGTGVPASDTEAHKWFLIAAQNGHKAAQFEVGKLFENGRGAPASQAMAVQWIQKSARQGYPPAQMDLGLKYLSGTGVEQSAERATFWLSYVVGESRTPPVLINGSAVSLTSAGL